MTHLTQKPGLSEGAWCCIVVCTMFLILAAILFLGDPPQGG